ncbi:MAG TPA: MarR family winged helix-turn-helix transcriptional regulator [Longimicrobiaceae bacterium]|nr:MarR family winged helix-turn-helix transcriptional regulator [Longimicrobiaceae bacterium]
MEALERCAAAVMDVGLRVSRVVRREAWRSRSASLTDAQYRTLAMVNAYPDSAPSEVAEYLMLSRPAMTRVLDELVRMRLVSRRTDTQDRRRLTLRVTARGQRRLDEQFAVARDAVASRLGELTAAECEQVTRALELLRPSFELPALADAPEETEEGEG